VLKKDYLWQRVFFVFVFFCLAAVPVRASTVLVFGDSLSAAYGMREEEGWVALLQKTLPEHQFVNESVSGEISANGLKRLPDALKKHKPDVLVIELGANDGLRGATIKSIHDNLAAIIEACQQNNALVLLAGMQLPPNYGMTYTQKFQVIFPQLADNYQIKLIPFLLAGFGDKHEFFQADGIHPNEDAQKKIAENVWEVLHTMFTTGKVAVKP